MSKRSLKQRLTSASDIEEGLEIILDPLEVEEDSVRSVWESRLKARALRNLGEGVRRRIEKEVGVQTSMPSLSTTLSVKVRQTGQQGFLMSHSLIHFRSN